MRDRAIELRAIARKRREHEGMSRELDDCDFIPRRESIGKPARGILHRARLRQDAGAGINHHRDACWIVSGVEVGDALLDAVLEQTGNLPAPGR